MKKITVTKYRSYGTKITIPIVNILYTKESNNATGHNIPASVHLVNGEKIEIDEFACEVDKMIEKAEEAGK